MARAVVDAAHEIGEGLDMDVAVLSFLFAVVMVPLVYGLIVFRRRKGETGDGDSRRKVYALTALGEKVLVLEGERLASLSRLASDVAKRLGGVK